MLNNQQTLATYTAENRYYETEVDLGEGVTPPPPQGFDPLPTQRVPPLYYFEMGANIY